MSEVWTVGKLLQWTTDYLKKQGADSPRLDAEVLLAHCRKCPRIALYTAFEEIASEELRNTFRGLVKQRAEGMPVAYLVGEREFFSLKFAVSPAVLIPRPETEFLILRALDLLKERNAPADVVDVGTGSGCIAVTVAKQNKTARLTAIDVSPDALEIAAKNAEKHGVTERVVFAEGDLLAGFPPQPTWDLILSNPPYVSEPEYAALDKTVKNYEPRGALVGGPNGTELIARLIEEVVPRLRSGGTFLCELSPMIEPAVREMLSAQPELEVMPTIKDISHLPRVVEARKK